MKKLWDRLFSYDGVPLKFSKRMKVVSVCLLALTLYFFGFTIYYRIIDGQNIAYYQCGFYTFVTISASYYVITRDLVKQVKEFKKEQDKKDGIVK